MSRIIEFSIVPKENHGLHQDFLMRISSISIEEAFDTYYFWDGEYYTDDYKVIMPQIETHLIKCKNAVLKLSEKEHVYIPVDFSDEYYGAFKVTSLSDTKSTYKFEYGCVRKEIVGTPFYLENDDTASLDIGNSFFDIDFSIILQKEDVIDSFRLPVLADMQGGQ